jgi:hypothetical protein
MVHVLDLLGCTVAEPTTQAALGATPEAICPFLRLLPRHRKAVNPELDRMLEHAWEHQQEISRRTG